MTKVIILSIQSQHAVNILKGFKTEELRKSVPKGFRGWVYIYVTLKRPVLINKNYISEFYEVLDTAVKEYKKSAYQDEVLNGKVVARFWFDETYYIKQAVNVYGDELNQISIYDNKSYGWKAPKEQQEILKQLCLTEQEVLDYVKGKGANAWNIKQLEIFDKPLELKNFYKLSVGKVESAYIQLDKAPQSWQYVYVKGESK